LVSAVSQAGAAVNKVALPDNLYFAFVGRTAQLYSSEEEEEWPEVNQGAKGARVAGDTHLTSNIYDIF
jgi:hypothetical protein